MLKQKLQYFPITAFAVIMGLTGLSIAFGKFSHLQFLPYHLHYGFTFASLSLFILFFILYGLKLIWYPNEVKADFKHRIRINFFSSISISLLLLSISTNSIFPFLSISLWWLGVILHTIFMFKTISFWIQHNFEIHHFNPAWFIPVVGNILVPISGVEYAPLLISYFYFVVGFFFWIVLFTIFLYRAIFHAQLPEKFIPTFFILLAPPAIGFISYMRITASWDSFAIFLLFMAYFFIALLIVMYKSFKQLKFFMSWWAFTFPLAAVTIASVLAFQISHLLIFKILAWTLLIATLAAISIVAWQTAIHIKKGEICVKEE